MTATHEMRHADAAWLHMDRPSNLMVITAALWFDEPLDEARLRATLEERLVRRYPPFRRRIAEHLTGPCWEDAEDVDLDLHVHRYALPAPGDRAALERAVGDLMSQPLDRARPLWSLHLLDGYGAGSAIVVRMHHAIADGIALAQVMLGLADDGDARARRPVAEERGRAPLPLEGSARELARLGRAAAGETADLLLHPSHVAQLGARTAGDLRALAELLTAPDERRHPLHDDLGVVQRAAWSRGIPLADVKALARRHGATVNDVLVAAVAGGVRAHLAARGEDVADVHAMVPFNLRGAGEPLPRDLGNRFGLVLLALPVGLADPVARLHEASARMTALKRSRQGEVSYAVLDAMGHAPVGLESRFVDLFSAKATMVLTNVPGPQEPIHVAGSRVGGVLVWAPCSGAVGMSVSIFSYDGEVTVGFMVNGRLVDDAGELVAAVETAVDELLAT